MARKLKKQGQTNKTRRNVILSAVRAYLNMNTLEEYQVWCVEQGFCTSLNKSQNEVYREYGKVKQREALRALKKFNIRRNIKSIIHKLHAKEIEYEDLISDTQKAIYNGIYDSECPDNLRDTLLLLCVRSNILDDAQCIEMIVRVVDYHKDWIRPVAAWKPQGKNSYRQFQSLIQHLFCCYEMPKFMDSVWKSNYNVVIGWFIHLGLGKNIRNAKSIPVKLTKKMAHYYSQAPDNYNARTALRWAQVHALGGTRKIADAVSETRLGRYYNNDDFWTTVIQFFINNPLLDRVHYGPIVDYIFDKKYADNDEFIEMDGDSQIYGEQPEFAMKGRTVVSLLRDVSEWHRHLGKVEQIGSLKWKSCGLAGLYFVEKDIIAKEKKIWTIRELLSRKELFVEGHMQNHCVSSYDGSCESGESSIWTMEVLIQRNLLKLLTIEVDNESRKIIEVRGRHNRIPLKNEMTILKCWAAKTKLSIEQYVCNDE